MFQNCYSLIAVTMPTAWGNVYSANGMFSSCESLKSIVLPTAMNTVNVLNDFSNMFSYCVSLVSVANTQYLGSSLQQASLSNAFMNCYALTSNIVIDSLISSFSCQGVGGLSKIPSVRLTRAGSTFGNTPHVDVSKSDMSASALNDLFGDLPTIAGKTITITGCTGAGTCTKSIATGKGWTVTG